jgi:uncharacterized protein (TIGR03435 family)
MKFFLLAAAIAVLCRAQSPAFEAASVKLNPTGGNPRFRAEPGRLTVSNMTLKALVRIAYDVRDIQVAGGPPWFDADHWDISATAGREVSDSERLSMLQTLLEDRFQLKIHRDTKELPVYALTVGKNGAKLTPNTDRAPQRIQLQASGGLFMMMGQDIPMPKLADVLFGQVGRIVIDRTGLQGSFDYKLQWAPDPANAPNINGAKMESSPDGASIFTAVQEQLGLKLESTKGPVQILVIDSAEKAKEN